MREKFYAEQTLELAKRAGEWDCCFAGYCPIDSTGSIMTDHAAAIQAILDDPTKYDEDGRMGLEYSMRRGLVKSPLQAGRYRYPAWQIMHIRYYLKNRQRHGAERCVPGILTNRSITAIIIRNSEETGGCGHDI